jgi:hypothetical protein
MCKPPIKRVIEWNLSLEMISAIIIAAARNKTHRVAFFFTTVLLMRNVNRGAERGLGLVIASE